MSGQATGWCYEYVTLGDPIAKSILASLADNADDEGLCCPRQDLTADKTEYSLSTVKRRLKWLEKVGIIEVIRKRAGAQKTVNLYKLDLSKSFNIPENIIRDIDKIEQVSLTHSKNDTSMVQLEEGEDVIAENLDPKGNGSVARKNANSLCDKVFKLVRAFFDCFKVG